MTNRTFEDIGEALLVSARAWDKEVCLLGNIQAGEIESFLLTALGGEARRAELERWRRAAEIERPPPITELKLDGDQGKLIEARFALEAADRVTKALRAQVDALTAELASDREGREAMTKQLAQAGRASAVKLARVKALASKWRAIASSYKESRGYWSDYVADCADELEDALEDTPGDLLCK